MKLTQGEIEALVCPAGKKDALVFDEEQRGLGVRIAKTAKKGSMAGKSYLVQYRLAGRKQRLPIGACSAISLKSAREATRAMLGDVAKGRNPAAERKQAVLDAKEKDAQEALTVGVLIETWERRHLANKRERYSAEAPRALRFAFKKQLNFPAATLSPKTVKAVLNTTADDGKKAMARVTGAYGRACFGWAIGKDLLTENPFAGIKIDAVASRHRVLSDDELKAIWRATEGPGAYNDIVRMLIVTGQRREEAAEMTRDEISPDLSTWTVPASRTKNGITHIVPLSPQAQAIVRAVPRLARDNDKPEFLFLGIGGAFRGFSRAKLMLDRRSGVTDWRLHDLRRTMATGLQRLGVRLEVTEAVLNHVSGSRAGIVGIYQRHEWSDEKRAALNAWGAHVAAIVERRKPLENVTPIRRGV